MANLAESLFGRSSTLEPHQQAPRQLVTQTSEVRLNHLLGINPDPFLSDENLVLTIWDLP